MRRLALTLLLAAPTLAVAQPSTATRVGLGIRLGADIAQFDARNGFDIAPTPQFSVPIDINGVARVEPEIGFSSFSIDSDGSSQTVRQTSTGVAVSALLPADDLTLTLGARARYIRSSFDFNSGGGSNGESVASAIGIGPFAGGEYPFSNRFALGVEAGLQYLSYSDDNENNDDSISSLSTTAALTARIFL